MPLYALPDGVTLSLKVIAIDPDLILAFEDATLSAAGQSLELGTTPGIHDDLQWELLLPYGAPFDQGHPVTLQLTTTSDGFTDSLQFTETVRPSSSRRRPTLRIDYGVRGSQVPGPRFEVTAIKSLDLGPGTWDHSESLELAPCKSVRDIRRPGR